eukprot:scaffold10560_cov133-Isochrysis_galbana.AAC.15
MYACRLSKTLEQFAAVRAVTLTRARSDLVRVYEPCSGVKCCCLLSRPIVGLSVMASLADARGAWPCTTSRRTIGLAHLDI